jgi:hypothetical protein
LFLLFFHNTTRIGFACECRTRFETARTSKVREPLELEERTALAGSVSGQKVVRQ